MLWLLDVMQGRICLMIEAEQAPGNQNHHDWTGKAAKIPIPFGSGACCSV